MTYLNKFKVLIAEHSLKKEKNREIRRLIRNTQSIAAHMIPNKSRKIPGVETDTFLFGDYVLKVDYLIRGDLYEYFKMATKHSLEASPIISYGDQTRVFGSFVGLCRDNEFSTTTQLKELNKLLEDVIKNNYTMIEDCSSPTNTFEL